MRVVGPLRVSERYARGWFAATALVVVVAVVVQLVVTATTTGGFFPTNPQRTLNLFAYFTVQSNVLVGITSARLARRLETGDLLARALRLAAVLGIFVTGVVYHAVLRQLFDLQGAAAVADVLLHTVSPLMCVGGWLLLGPRGGADLRSAVWALLFPVLWLAFTLVRGAVVGFWPYPFVDVDELGLGRVVINCLVLTGLFAGLALGVRALDRRLPVSRAGTAVPRP